MSQQSYLTCHLQNSHYAISTDNVLEIFPLPELQIVPETPADLLGMLNLRGQMLPIMHLQRRISRSPLICAASDTVVILDCSGFKIGVIVDRVSEVCVLDDLAIDRDLAYGRQGHTNSAFLNGVTPYGDDSLLILNPDAVVSLPDEVADWVWQADETGGITTSVPLEQIGSFYDLYFPTATTTERQLLHQRAADLRPAIEINDNSQAVPLAVFGLGGEYFGISLATVREFINTQNIRPIPCAPSQIIGNMNLRGEIMTLVDMRPALNLSIATAPHNQAVVTQIGDVVAGLSIDELHDILYIDRSAFAPVPVANQQSRTGLIESTTPYRDTMLSVLNLPQLLNIA
jgi:purine-binding chemotaxis protein CheW